MRVLKRVRIKDSAVVRCVCGRRVKQTTGRGRVKQHCSAECRVNAWRVRHGLPPHQRREKPERREARRLFAEWGYEGYADAA